MIALTRLGLFIFAWLVIFFTTLVIFIEKESNIYLENIVGIIFLIATILLSIWIYFTHKFNHQTKDLKEAQYIMIFVCIVTSASGFLGFC